MTGQKAGSRAGIGPIGTIDIWEKLARERRVPGTVVDAIDELRGSVRRRHVGDHPYHRRHLATRHEALETDRELRQIPWWPAETVKPIGYGITPPARRIAGRQNDIALHRDRPAPELGERLAPHGEVSYRRTCRRGIGDGFRRGTDTERPGVHDRQFLVQRQGSTRWQIEDGDSAHEITASATVACVAMVSVEHDLDGIAAGRRALERLRERPDIRVEIDRLVGFQSPTEN
nr:hypothetical protein [Sphingomonas sp. OK281]